MAITPTTPGRPPSREEVARRLEALAQRGEFWGTYGVGERQADLLGAEDGVDLGPVVDAFEHLFEVEKRHTPCPTSAAERTYRGLKALSATAEEIPQLVEAYDRLLAFERQRLGLDESRHALEALTRIAGSRLEFESWAQNVAEYMKDPEGYAEVKKRQAEEREKSRQEMLALSSAAPSDSSIVKTERWVRVGAITLTRKP